MIEHLRRHFGRFVLDRYVSRILPKPPIFIGGAPRSGTTLLISILGSHPHIHAIDYETASFHPRFRPEKLLAALLFEPGNRRRKRIARGKTRYCEKTPANIRHIDELFDFYKGRIRFINIFRDGRDVVTSRHPEDPDQYWVPIRRWVQDTKRGIEAERRGLVLSIRYEDLVAQPEATIRKVCDYIGEPFHPAMLEHQNAANSISKMGKMAWMKGAQAINTDSLRKWEKPEHRERLEEFYRHKGAVRLLQELGYESSTDAGGVAPRASS